MTLPLRDVRGKLPVETYAVVKGWAVAHGLDEGEVLRMVLTEWAEKITHANTVAQKFLAVEGITGKSRD